MNRPLYSERAGRARTLSKGDFASLVWRAVIAWAFQRRLYAEAFESHMPASGSELGRPRISDVDAFLLDHLHVSTVSGYDLMHAELRTSFLYGEKEDILFDLSELLHRECVSLPNSTIRAPDSIKTVAVAPFDQQAGQRLFRERLNPVLAKHAPPMEMRPDGHVLELPSEGMTALVEEQLPDAVEPELRDPIQAAVERFFRREASRADRVHALRDLADVLERLRPQIKKEMFRKDESDLFNIANHFRIRHHDRAQKGEYDKDVWLEWIFYVYLATAKAMIKILHRQEGSAPPSGRDDDIPF